MLIRRAETGDIRGLHELLYQVNLIHHNGRPDLFRYGTRKYTDDELKEIIADASRPILVAVDKDGVAGYAFCVYQQYMNDNIRTDVKTLYIDDLCVDERRRGQHIGKQLYDAVLGMARENGCYNVTLNVWCLNEGAMKFYERCGMRPLKIAMEQILERDDLSGAFPE